MTRLVPVRPPPPRRPQICCGHRMYTLGRQGSAIERGKGRWHRERRGSAVQQLFVGEQCRDPKGAWRRVSKSRIKLAIWNFAVSEKEVKIQKLIVFLFSFISCMFELNVRPNAAPLAGDIIIVPPLFQGKQGGGKEAAAALTRTYAGPSLKSSYSPTRSTQDGSLAASANQIPTA